MSELGDPGSIDRSAVEAELEAERAYERASADVVLALSSVDAETLADALALLVDVVEATDAERDEWRRLAALIRAELEARP